MLDAVGHSKPYGSLLSPQGKGGGLFVLPYISKRNLKAIKPSTFVGHICNNVKRFLWTPTVKNVVALLSPELRMGEESLMVGSPPCWFILIRLPLGKGGSLGLIDSMCLRNEVPIKTTFTRAPTASLVAALITVSHVCTSRKNSGLVPDLGAVDNRGCGWLAPLRSFL